MKYNHTIHQRLVFKGLGLISFLSVDAKLSFCDGSELQTPVFNVFRFNKNTETLVNVMFLKDLSSEESSLHEALIISILASSFNYFLGALNTCAYRMVHSLVAVKQSVARPQAITLT